MYSMAFPTRPVPPVMSTTAGIVREPSSDERKEDSVDLVTIYAYDKVIPVVKFPPSTRSEVVKVVTVHNRI